jgi:hypothetical protein
MRFLDLHQPIFEISHPFLLLLPNPPHEEVKQEEDANENEDGHKYANSKVVFSSIDCLSCGLRFCHITFRQDTAGGWLCGERCWSDRLC